jgi:hypothetical protein
MQQLQQAFQQQREESPPHDNEDDDHHGGGRGPGFAAGFDNFAGGRGRGFAAGFGHARRVPVGNPTNFDAETFSNYSAEHGGDHRRRHPEWRHNDYFEWETKVEQIFDLYEYPAEKKAKLAAIEFKGYAIT